MGKLNIKSKVDAVNSVLMPISFVLKLDVLIPFERVAGRIFQIANTVPGLVKLPNTYW